MNMKTNFDKFQLAESDFQDRLTLIETTCNRHGIKLCKVNLDKDYDGMVLKIRRFSKAVNGHEEQYSVQLSLDMLKHASDDDLVFAIARGSVYCKMRYMRRLSFIRLLMPLTAISWLGVQWLKEWEMNIPMDTHLNVTVLTTLLVIFLISSAILKYRVLQADRAGAEAVGKEKARTAITKMNWQFITTKKDEKLNLCTRAWCALVNLYFDFTPFTRTRLLLLR